MNESEVKDALERVQNVIDQVGGVLADPLVNDLRIVAETLDEIEFDDLPDLKAIGGQKVSEETWSELWKVARAVDDENAIMEDGVLFRETFDVPTVLNLLMDLQRANSETAVISGRACREGQKSGRPACGTCQTCLRERLEVVETDLNDALKRHRVYMEKIGEVLETFRERRPNGEPAKSDWREIERAIERAAQVDKMEQDLRDTRFLAHVDKCDEAFGGEEEVNRLAQLFASTAPAMTTGFRIPDAIRALRAGLDRDNELARTKKERDELRAQLRDAEDVLKERHNMEGDNLAQLIRELDDEWDDVCEQAAKDSSTLPCGHPRACLRHHDNRESTCGWCDDVRDVK